MHHRRCGPEIGAAHGLLQPYSDAGDLRNESQQCPQFQESYGANDWDRQKPESEE
jgi:hypothetical protein